MFFDPYGTFVCPILRTDRAEIRHIYKENLELSGYDLAERFSLRQMPCGGEKTCFKLGSARLIKDTQQILSNGLPDEYSVIATFRVRRNTKKERWFLWQTLTHFGTPQDSILIDGNKKVVEFTAKHDGGSVLHYTFKSRELHHLFDRQWHKLGISIQSNIISLYIDCKLIERRQIDRKDGIDLHGSSLITALASDGKPVDIELQRITIYCNPKHAAQENCCEISDEMCTMHEKFQATMPSFVVGKVNALQSTDEVPKEKCLCFPNKGEHGLPGSAGLPGQKGEKGLQGEKGIKGEIGTPGVIGEKGEEGLDGADGHPGSSGPKLSWRANAAPSSLRWLDVNKVCLTGCVKFTSNSMHFVGGFHLCEERVKALPKGVELEVNFTLAILHEASASSWCFSGAPSERRNISRRAWHL
ncbi:collagen alpha-1(XIX) chain-like [Rhinophrynus dorsalis]